MVLGSPTSSKTHKFFHTSISDPRHHRHLHYHKHHRRRRRRRAHFDSPNTSTSTSTTVEDLSSFPPNIQDYCYSLNAGCSPVLVPASYDFEQVAGLLATEKCDLVTMVNDGGEVVDLGMVGDLERINDFLKLGVPLLGAAGESLVGAAIVTREEDNERLEHLVKAEVNYASNCFWVEVGNFNVFHGQEWSRMIFFQRMRLKCIIRLLLMHMKFFYCSRM